MFWLYVQVVLCVEKILVTGYSAGVATTAAKRKVVFTEEDDEYPCKGRLQNKDHAWNPQPPQPKKRKRQQFIKISKLAGTDYQEDKLERQGSQKMGVRDLEKEDAAGRFGPYRDNVFAEMTIDTLIKLY